jgi:hypothetical protein
MGAEASNYKNHDGGKKKNEKTVVFFAINEKASVPNLRCTPIIPALKKNKDSSTEEVFPPSLKD